MKQITFLIAALFTVGSVFAQSATPLEFQETKFSFGKIKQNIPATHVFVFKNVSDKPVAIESAVAGCGCTTPEFPKGVIAKGASEKIKVTYNAAAMGAFTKQVTVKVANVTDPIVLNIEGEVVASDAAAANLKPVKEGEVKEKTKTNKLGATTKSKTKTKI